MATINIQSIHCYSFNLPLVHPFFAQQQIKNREGFIVHVISDYGQMGFGEVSPLPGVSAESLKKAIYQVEILVRELKNAQTPIEAPVLLEWLAGRIPEALFCPSVRFGFESAIINMVANFHGKSVRAFLRSGDDQDVFSAGLLQGTPADVLNQARFLTAKGYMTFQLKVGSRNIPLDVQKVRNVRQVMAAGAKLRLDAGRAWRLDEAVVFAQSIGKDRIEYIEEPLADPIQLEDLSRRTDMPVAVNETVLEKPVEAWAGRVGVGHAVVRPMTLGVVGYLRFLEVSAQYGVHIVVSSAFESGVGMTMLANLAALTYSVANLGTANWFEEDLLLRPVVVDKGCVPSDRMIFETKFFHSIFSRQLKVV